MNWRRELLVESKLDIIYILMRGRKTLRKSSRSFWVLDAQFYPDSGHIQALGDMQEQEEDEEDEEEAERAEWEEEDM